MPHGKIRGTPAADRARAERAAAQAAIILAKHVVPGTLKSGRMYPTTARKQYARTLLADPNVLVKLWEDIEDNNLCQRDWHGRPLKIAIPVITFNTYSDSAGESSE